MNRATVSKLVLAVFAIAWLFLVITNYYIVHKPFTLENLLAILNALGDVFVAGALFWLVTAIGRRVLRRLAFETPWQAMFVTLFIRLTLIA